MINNMQRLRVKRAPDVNSKRAVAARSKIQQRQVTKILNTHIIMSSPATTPGGTILMDRAGNVTPATAILAQAIGSHPFKWTVTGLALCRSQTGVTYFDAYTIDFVAPDRYIHLSKAVGKWINEQIRKQTNPQHIICNAFIASINGFVPHDEVIFKIFSREGVWKYLALWEEVEVNKKKLSLNAARYFEDAKLINDLPEEA